MIFLLQDTVYLVPAASYQEGEQKPTCVASSLHYTHKNSPRFSLILLIPRCVVKDVRSWKSGVVSENCIK